MKIFGKEFLFNGKSVALKEELPTKLSQLANDIGAGGGIRITTSATEPTTKSPGDYWYKEV